jgi:hypothetical protein
MTEQIQPIVFTPEMLARGERLAKIFLPYASKQQLEYFKKTPEQKSAQLVHYTTAEAALNIIRTKRFWMRNTVCMADYREVQHGFSIFKKFFDDDVKRKNFTDALDTCSAGAAVEAIESFNNAWKNTIQMETYITSLSEHPRSEDVHGRLSMWRAFGAAPARVALVLNIPSDSLASLALGIEFSPVAYPSETAAHDVIDDVTKNVHAECEYLRRLERPILVQMVFRMLLFGVVCLKHEGFHEEREWRAIYQPKIRSSRLMKPSTKVINGVPQIVYEIPMDKTASAELADLDFAKMFDHLIVGPTPYVWPMYEAFVDALTEAGVGDARNRLVPSGIPIRA